MFFRHWRRKRILRDHLIPQTAWETTVSNLPLLHGLTEDELLRLRQLATLFLHEKSLEPVEGLQLDHAMRYDLAAQTVLPILNLGIDWYDGWTSLVLYPDEFATRQDWMDEAGVVHARREIRSGEAWQIGPVVLSWADVTASGGCEGYNAVIHEMAHKLDMSNGAMDGCPRLSDAMTAAAWRHAFKPAYEDFCRRVDDGEETPLDPYAAEAPEEFFAVMSEYFFEWPELLHQEYPAVYEQLAQFYRQDTLCRLASLAASFSS
ncbi:MtfA peptidase [Novimethylophilus kurashikiensis]|uniref:MtfA peptidase n=1 Tax=Novimethylophilus kurashikiensis TaxID=1825523 RepID=A0A2R5FC52_9PROT|nr:M90 family metallopeptidase [Novimethylophilus kurashikiensis]GBG15595.1 MtfA peptidase [Novimethylophilus kurashikiensis]